MRKILVIQTASIGDVILATAILEKLHHVYPESRIDFLVRKGMESLFWAHPFLHRLLLWDKSDKYRSFFKLLRDVRREKYDLVVNIQRFAMTGILTVLSGATTTIGFDKNPLSRFFSIKIPHEIGIGIHETTRNQKLIAELTDKQAEKPRLYPLQKRDTRFGIRDSGYAIRDTGYGIHGTKISHPGSQIPNPVSPVYYTVSPGSLWFTKQFPAERWAELIREMPEGATVYLLGSKADFDLCEMIRDSRFAMVDKGKESDKHPIEYPGSRIVNLAGQLTLLESAALMQGAKMNFTNDSAPLHLASAVNAPVTAVYCSTTPGFGFGPLSDNSAIVEVEEHLSCRPCGLHGRNACPEGHFRCAVDIDQQILRSRF